MHKKVSCLSVLLFLICFFSICQAAPSDILDTVSLCQAIKSPTASGNEIPISYLTDGIYDYGIFIGPNKRKYNVLNFESNTSPQEFTFLNLRLYVTYLEGGSQTVTVYSYNADGSTINTSFSMDFTLSSLGWNDLDISGLLSVMEGFDFIKIRIVALDGQIVISEAQMTTEETIPEVEADFTGTPVSGGAPLTVSFTDTSIVPPGNYIVSWEWDFDNDGVVDSTEQHPVFTYNTGGYYTVSLKTTDTTGATDTESKPNYISVIKLKADFDGSIYLTGEEPRGTAPLNISFTDRSIVPPGRYIVSREWDFDNDGVIDSTEQYPSHVYDNVGYYTVSLKITDSTDETDTTVKTDYILVDIDTDHDTIIDADDNCPNTTNFNQSDLDNDGIGDACDNDTDIIHDATVCTSLKKATTPETGPVSVLGLLTDGLFDQTIRIQHNKKYDVLDLTSNTATQLLKSLNLKLYVTSLDGGSQAVRVYSYNADGSTINTSLSLDFTMSQGWNDLDISGLLPVMAGFNSVKVRVVAVDSWIDLSEAGIIADSFRDDTVISIDPSAIDFGSVEVMEYTWAGAVISNTGVGKLYMGAITAQPPFFIIDNGCENDVLWANQSCSCIIGFRPEAAGPYTGIVTVESSDGENPEYEIHVTGTAAQVSTTIAGVVTDDATGQPLSDVEVTLNVTRDLNLSPADYNYGSNWTQADYDLVAANDETRRVSDIHGDEAIQYFQVRNPYELTDSIKVTWNGSGEDSRDSKLSQAIIADQTGLLTSVRLLVGPEYETGYRYGYAMVHLKSKLGGDEEHTLAASAGVPYANIPAGFTWVEFVFPEPVQVKTGQTYYLELLAQTRLSTTPGEVRWAYNDPGSYADGEGYLRDNLLWNTINGCFGFQTVVDDQLDQSNDPNCTTCRYIGTVGWPEYNTVYLGILNRNRSAYDYQDNAQMKSGPDDVTLSGLIEENLSDYYDTDSWITIKAENFAGRYEYPFSYIATDMAAIEFVKKSITSTGSDGVYSLENLPKGTYTITYHAAGYYPESVNGTLISGAAIQHDIALTQAEPISISITSPIDGYSSSNDTVYVEGNVTALSQVTVNGIQAIATGDTFSAWVDLNYGSNTITADALGQYGQTASDSITVNRPYPTPAVSIAGAPETIGLGQTAILSWDSTYADSCSIDQGIGTVAAVGATIVTPSTTTTYTITAIGPGGTATDSVTVVVLGPPTASISANPGTIPTGGSSELTWTTTDADTVSIDQGIGSVALSGSVFVTPSTTTTYTITATGLGGTATESITVIVADQPTASISANPETIPIGGSSELTWIATNADTITIDPDVGTVNASGAVSVAPSETTTYTLTAIGPGGTATSNVTVTVNNPFTLIITSPSAGSTISRPDVMVEGTIIHSGALETGIVVNGVPAIVHGNQFAANHVPLTEGENTLTATATDTDGNVYSVEQTIDAETAENFIRILANPESGLLPLAVTLDIRGTFSIDNSVVSYSGPEPVDSVIQKLDRQESDAPYEGEGYSEFNEDYGMRRVHGELAGRNLNLMKYHPFYFLAGRGNFARGRDYVYTTLNDGIVFNGGLPASEYSNSMRHI
ncbi:MAG: PKD domain-containing protein, partial [Desulfobacterales bacterium]